MGTEDSVRELPPTRQLKLARPRGSSVDALTASLGDGWIDDSNPADVEAVRIDPVVMDRFEILGRLGHGGMGVVYLARDPTLDRNVALKVLNQRRSSRESERLRREARALARLSHPNVVQVFEVGEYDERVFIVMELVRGETLRKWQRGRSVAEILEVYLQAGQGLAAAHAAGLVHRDFKPANVLLGDDGRVRVLDFGVARVGRSRDDISISSPDASRDPPPEPGHANATEIVGTPGYMAPEQLEGTTATSASDQFGFCVALFEALYQVRPYPGTTLLELREAVAAGPPSFPEGGAVHARIRAALRRGLSSDPRERWPDMESLLAAMGPRHHRRMPWVIGGLAVAGCIAAGLVAMPVEDDAPLCHGGEQQLAEVWGAEQAARLEQGLRSTGLPYAERVSQEVTTAFDAYGVAWVEHYRRVCEATHVHGTQGPEDMDRAMACLSRRRRDLATAVELLSTAEAGPVERARSIVEGLEEVKTCLDLETLRTGDRSLGDPEQQEVVEGLEDILARAQMLERAGLYAEALGLVEEIEPKASAVETLSLDARTAFLRGTIHDELGDDRSAYKALERAYFAAEELHDEQLALRAARRLAFVIGVRQQQLDQGLQWAERACAVARRGGRAFDEATCLVTRSKVLRHRGDYDAAQADLDRALPVLEHERGPTHRDTLDAINSLGVLSSEQRKFEDALPLFRRYLVAQMERLGPVHPLVAVAYNNIGTAEQGLGQNSEALASFRLALEIRERALGRSHRMVGLTLTNIGIILAIRGEPDEARATFERALRVAVEAWGPDHPHVASVHINLATLAGNQGETMVAARHHRKALAVLMRTLGEVHPETIGQRIRVGRATRDSGHAGAAVGVLKAVVPVIEASRGPNDLLMAHAMLELAQTTLELGRTREALGYARTSVAVYEHNGVADHDAAEARFVEATVLWEVGKRSLARQTAQRARDALAAGPSGAHGGIAYIDAWLAEHVL